MSEPTPTIPSPRHTDARVAATVTSATDTGWRALTDEGTDLDLPRNAATRLRRLQPGQRVTVELDDGQVVRIAIG